MAPVSRLNYNFCEFCCCLKGCKINKNEHFDLILVQTRTIYVLKMCAKF